MIKYIYNYFSDWHHLLFWGMILIFSIYEGIKRVYAKRNYIKLWLKRHNIGKKYK